MFLNDRVLINAALFQFAIIGEAIVQVDSDVLAKYEYPWHKVRGFRNFILHEYHAIEFRIVWEAIQKDLPELKKVIHAISQTNFKTICQHSISKEKRLCRTTIWR
jgi:uncharacterized protein with HEPN domain